MNYSYERKIGFIGAGKVGCSLGKLFAQSGIPLSGYCSRSMKSAREAAEFTMSAAYENAADLVQDSDLIFLTVPDGMIRNVYEKLLREDLLRSRLLYHCSGALSASQAFPGIEAVGAGGASVHPIFPVSGRFTVYQELQEAFFCIEGDPVALSAAQDLLSQCGIRYQTIVPENKTKYHAGCVFASNLVCALMQQSFDLLCECGFTQEGARAALRPLILRNLTHVLEDGAVQALTGPVERCDAGTVAAHLNVLDGQAEEMYRVLSRSLVSIAQEKHPQTDYAKLRKLLDDTGDADT